MLSRKFKLCSFDTRKKKALEFMFVGLMVCLPLGANTDTCFTAGLKVALNLTPLRISCSGFDTGRKFGSNVRYFPKLRTFSYTLNQFPQTKQLLKSSHVAMKKKTYKDKEKVMRKDN